MTPFAILSIIVMTVGLIGTIFTIWSKVKAPQEALDKKQAVAEADGDGKNKLYDYQLADMGKRLDDSFTLASNHTHTVDVKVDKLIESMNRLEILVAKLETKIDERIPQKQ